MIEEKIIQLKKDLDAVILAHYYQEDDIQDIADFIGDSLELSKKAAETSAKVIVFCGVKFMAEVAKILNPEKKVLLPDLRAGCSLEESCKLPEFKKFREKHKDAVVVTYINSSADIKAISDIICTSSSAERIINKIPKEKEIIFAPDKYLGNYLQKKTGRKMILWEGSCIVHEQFSERSLLSLMAQYRNAHVIAHPECPENLLNYAHFIGSTSSLINYVSSRNGSDFIVLTEQGIIHQMQKKSPGSTFHLVKGIDKSGCEHCNKCPYMKLNTIEKLYECMLKGLPEIIMDEDLIKRARIPVDRMVEMSST